MEVARERGDEGIKDVLKDANVAYLAVRR